MADDGTHTTMVTKRKDVHAVYSRAINVHLIKASTLLQLPRPRTDLRVFSFKYRYSTYCLRKKLNKGYKNCCTLLVTSSIERKDDICFM